MVVEELCGGDVDHNWWHALFFISSIQRDPRAAARLLFTQAATPPRLHDSFFAYRGSDGKND